MIFVLLPFSNRKTSTRTSLLYIFWSFMSIVSAPSFLNFYMQVGPIARNKLVCPRKLHTSAAFRFVGEFFALLFQLGSEQFNLNRFFFPIY